MHPSLQIGITLSQYKWMGVLRLISVSRISRKKVAKQHFLFILSTIIPRKEMALFFLMTIRKYKFNCSAKLVCCTWKQWPFLCLKHQKFSRPTFKYFAEIINFAHYRFLILRQIDLERFRKPSDICFSFESFKSFNIWKVGKWCNEMADTQNAFYKRLWVSVRSHAVSFCRLNFSIY